MNNQKIKEIFPELHDNVIHNLSIIETYIKTKAKLFYKFDISYEITEEELPEDSHVYFEHFKKTKKATIRINLITLRTNMINYGIPIESLSGSVLACLISTICNPYIHSICIFKYLEKFELTENQSLQYTIDLISLSFAKNILNFPIEQITTKIGISLSLLLTTDLFKSKEDISEYVFKILNNVGHPIESEHYELKKLVDLTICQKNEIQEPGSSSDTV